MSVRIHHPLRKYDCGGLAEFASSPSGLSQGPDGISINNKNAFMTS